MLRHEPVRILAKHVQDETKEGDQLTARHDLTLRTN
jgi:hypothetical protein